MRKLWPSPGSPPKLISLLKAEESSAEHDGAEGHAHIPPPSERRETLNPMPWGATDPGRTARCGCCPVSPGSLCGPSSAAAPGSPVTGEMHKPARLGGPRRAGLTSAPQGCQLWCWHPPCHTFKGMPAQPELEGALAKHSPPFNLGCPLWTLICQHLCQGRVNSTGEEAASTPHTAGHYQRPSSVWSSSVISLQG